MTPIPKEIISLNPNEINFNDEVAVRSIIIELLNIIEQLAQREQQLEEEKQALRDEINRLKGEKGKPKFSPNVPKKENDVLKVVKEKIWTKREKKPRIKIDRVEYRRVDKKNLPPDAKHKGYRSMIVQDVKFKTNNVEYKLERYYSPSEKRLYEAELPEGVRGEFGNNLKAFIVYLYYACRVTEPKIKEILEESGIIISEGQISYILTEEKKEELTEEKEDIFKAGMECADYFHIDNTGGRHKGKNVHTQVICNELFSTFFITFRKDRNTIRSILGLEEDEKVDKIMLSDDAKQFLGIAVYHALCWIHEIRHYRKLNPLLDYHCAKLHDFLIKLWGFYERLKIYKESPDEKEKESIESEFDKLFSTKTGYEELDERIALTKEKKERLLLVLRFPEIPLHNNPAEIALRELVIKRKISSGTRSEKGKIAWENMMSILDTCRKHGINFFDYIRDIFSGRYAMPRLAVLIYQNALERSTTLIREAAPVLLRSPP